MTRTTDQMKKSDRIAAAVEKVFSVDEGRYVLIIQNIANDYDLEYSDLDRAVQFELRNR